MFPDLRFRVERTSGVIEVALPPFIQSAILRRAKPVQQFGLEVTGIALYEVRAGFLNLQSFGLAAFQHQTNIMPLHPLCEESPSWSPVGLAMSQESLPVSIETRLIESRRDRKR